MNDFVNILLPKNQNIVQRAGFITTVIIVLTIIFLHFPFGGYDNERYVITRYGNNPCPNQLSIDEVNKLTAAEVDERIQMYKKCSNDSELKTKSFSKWRSKSAIILWFASPVNAIISTIFAISIGIFWIFVFKDRGAQ